VYLLNSEHTPAAASLEGGGAPLLARIPRPDGDAFRVYGTPTAATLETVSTDTPACLQRWR
jgi:hypothetical protein